MIKLEGKETNLISIAARKQTNEEADKNQLAASLHLHGKRKKEEAPLPFNLNQTSHNQEDFQAPKVISLSLL